jgi:hypothetical protein
LPLVLQELQMGGTENTWRAAGKLPTARMRYTRAEA